MGTRAWIECRACNCSARGTPVHPTPRARLLYDVYIRHVGAPQLLRCVPSTRSYHVSARHALEDDRRRNRAYADGDGCDTCWPPIGSNCTSGLLVRRWPSHSRALRSAGVSSATRSWVGVTRMPLELLPGGDICSPTACAACSSSCCASFTRRGRRERATNSLIRARGHVGTQRAPSQHRDDIHYPRSSLRRGPRRPLEQPTDLPEPVKAVAHDERCWPRSPLTT